MKSSEIATKRLKIELAAIGGGTVVGGIIGAGVGTVVIPVVGSIPGSVAGATAGFIGVTSVVVGKRLYDRPRNAPDHTNDHNV